VDGPNLHVDEDRAVGAVRDRADHAVPMGRLCDPRATVHALDAAAGDAVPVHARGHGVRREATFMFLRSPDYTRGGDRSPAKFIPPLTQCRPV
jgi:hypothetical protein